MPVINAASLRIMLQSEAARGGLDLRGEEAPKKLLNEKFQRVFTQRDVDRMARVIQERTDAEAAIQKKHDEFSWFGEPTGDMRLGAGARGYYRHFQQGSVFWLPGWGAHEVHGSIRDKYGSLGWEGSYLGYPETDELGDGERYNNFEHGTILWTEALGAYIPLNIDVWPERFATGYLIHVTSGQGFTPGGSVFFFVDGLPGRDKPYDVGIVATALSDGRLPSGLYWFGHFDSDFEDARATLRALDVVSGKSATAVIPAVYPGGER